MAVILVCTNIFCPCVEYSGVFTQRDPGAVQTMLCAWGVLTAALFVQTFRMNVALGRDGTRPGGEHWKDSLGDWGR